MIEIGSKSKSGLVPTNGGAIIGAIIDHGTGNAGQMQSILGGVNDIGSMFFTGGEGLGDDYEFLDTMDNSLNGLKSPVPYIGIYDDYQSVQEYN